jgi:hypothetical protein
MANFLPPQTLTVYSECCRKPCSQCYSAQPSAEIATSRLCCQPIDQRTSPAQNLTVPSQSRADDLHLDAALPTPIVALCVSREPQRVASVCATSPPVSGNLLSLHSRLNI